MKLITIGLSHQTAPIELREKVYLSEGQLQPALINLKNHVKEVAILSTCNRLEIYMATDQENNHTQNIVNFICNYFSLDNKELQPHLYTYFDQDAVDHLMRVASGLDSMILGEPQIINQVNHAHQQAQLARTTGKYLNRLFNDSLHAGKRARNETGISKNTLSIGHAASNLIFQKFERPDDARILVLGAGEMAQLAIRALVQRGLTNISILNRTYSHAKTLADQYNITVYEWSDLWQEMTNTDIVITATGAPYPIIQLSDVKQLMMTRSSHLLTLIDIAVPRDLEATIADIINVTVYDIDDLNQTIDHALAQRQACIPTVENIINEECTKFTQWFASNHVTPIIKGLRQKVREVVHGEFEDALNRMENVNAHDRDILQRLAHRIVNKVLHEPTVNLRENATNSNVDDYSRIVRELFELTPIEMINHE